MKKDTAAVWLATSTAQPATESKALPNIEGASLDRAFRALDISGDIEKVHAHCVVHICLCMLPGPILPYMGSSPCSNTLPQLRVYTAVLPRILILLGMTRKAMSVGEWPERQTETLLCICRCPACRVNFCWTS